MTPFSMNPIAYIRTDFQEKFGVPRQSGLVPELTGRISFVPEYRHPDAVRGLEQFSHIWLVWVFSENVREGWSATVRPPRLGGNERVGVFASRSPFRPNPVGLSSVRLDRIEQHPDLGPVLHVSGIDMVDGTPILDIKPYIPYADSHPDATGGFTDLTPREPLAVRCADAMLDRIPAQKRSALLSLLAQDVRPSYVADPQREYGLFFAGYNVRFTVDDGVVMVNDIAPIGRQERTG